MGRNGQMERSISIGRVQPKRRSTLKGGPLFSKLTCIRLDQTDPLSFRPKFPEILVEWIAPSGTCEFRLDLSRLFYTSVNLAS